VDINLGSQPQASTYTQADLNRIIRTMRFVKDEVPALQVKDNTPKVE